TAKTDKSRAEVFDKLLKANIGVNVHYIPVYNQPYYQQLGFKPGYCPQAEAYYAHAITLPLFYELNAEQQTYIVEQLTGVLA
ncbi:MAG: UDP-4-amino-4,6-dideoxy-N-acetyl-beta-L-altrosamine transaminase, partial [Gammaproteobacteria bacterium]|nr:UDP-4-amino-4,6-dideoxy-N-acetyl-beta-L-altrosamine transaminase [Gammaproteobacteria bacterium]